MARQPSTGLCEERGVFTHCSGLPAAHALPYAAVAAAAAAAAGMASRQLSNSTARLLGMQGTRGMSTHPIDRMLPTAHASPGVQGYSAALTCCVPAAPPAAATAAMCAVWCSARTWCSLIEHWRRSYTLQRLLARWRSHSRCVWSLSQLQSARQSLQRHCLNHSQQLSWTYPETVFEPVTAARLDVSRDSV